MLNNGITLSQLEQLKTFAPVITIARAPIDRAVEIERLAALDELDYEVVRIEAADRMQIRTSVLDRAVAKKRRALGLDTDEEEGQGRAVKIIDPLPWHDAVGGDFVASALAAAVKVFTVMPDAAADVVALWVLHTWLVNQSMISPRLAVTSPTKGCGKTTVLRVLEKVTRRPKRAGSISPAALFRAVEALQPTILLDETEKYIEHGSDLHALLNEGHCRGATVLRVLGENLELREFAVYGAVAFARNGRLPDDLQQRSITIEMQRRSADEPLAELRDDRCEALHNLAKKCARWADDNGDDVAAMDPDVGALINRDADNWRPLFAIADVIGSDWPQRIREAAAVLMPRESETVGPTLLADICTIFAAEDRMTSARLCELLAQMEGRPWAEWRAGKPLTPNQLARLLKPFHVYPDNIRVGDRVPKGYQRNQFEAAWTRYLPAEGGSEPLQSYNADGSRETGTFQSATAGTGVADQKCEKPASNGHCSDVAGEKGDDRVCEYCGRPDDGADPVLTVHVDGDEHLLHRGCQDAWLDADDQEASIMPGEGWAATS